MKKRPIARPLNIIDAIKQIDIFLGMPQKTILQYNRIDIAEKKRLPHLLIPPINSEYNTFKTHYYKRIDTLDKEQLKALAERKLALHIHKDNRYNTFESVIEDEIRFAKSKQGWFNKHTEKGNYYPLQHYIDFLANDFKDNSVEAVKKKFAEPLNELEYKTFLLEEEKKKYQPILDEILANEKLIKEPKDKIVFLEMEKQKYIRDLSMESLASSGTIGFNGMELFMDREISNRIKEIELITPQQNEQKKDIKDNKWFIVGLLFATGKLEKYYLENKNGMKPEYSAPSIAKELGDPNYHKYILATMNNYNTDKNIYCKNTKIKQIFKHCTDNKIEMVQFFIDKYNNLQPD